MVAMPEVKTVGQLKEQPAEYQDAVRKIVRSHVLNELHGARTWDEPAIALAPDPQAKYLTCRIAMEEYHHHVRFKALADEIGIPPEESNPSHKRPLNIFEFPLKTWEEFCVLKMLGDMAEILQVEDLLHCTFIPLRNLARATMPEEKFHAQTGLDFCKGLVQAPSTRQLVQDAIDRFYPQTPHFFGSAKSKNNEIFRRHGLKQRTNEQMREDYLSRSRAAIESIGLVAPPIEGDIVPPSER